MKPGRKGNFKTALDAKGPDPEGWTLWAWSPGNHVASSPEWGREGDHTTDRHARTPLRVKASAGTTGPNWLHPGLSGPHMHPSHQYSPRALGCSVKLFPLHGDQEGPVYT